MSVNNLPDDEKEVMNILAKAGYLKASNDKLEVSLESYNTLNIQPKKNIFGAKIKVEDNGSITPTLTFDTKKLRDNSNRTDIGDSIDDALNKFWEENDV
jgi:hypothetical protein